MRLVNADELMIKFEAAQKEATRHGREFASCFYDHGGEVSTNWYCVEDMVDNAPTVDAVPVVRCEDCKYWERSMSNRGYCKDMYGFGRWWKADDYCSYGERKGGDHAEGTV